VDDGSTDGCCDVFRNGLDLGTVILVSQGRHGVAGARNAGAQRAGQPLVIFLDAHCLVHPAWLGYLFDALEQHPNAIVGPKIRDLCEPNYAGCGAVLVDDQLRYRWLACREGPPYGVGLLPGGCMAMRRRTFQALGGFDAMRHYGLEDVELCLAAWRLGIPVLGVPAACIDHLFRTTPPFFAPSPSYLYNQIRTALIHFQGNRLETTLRALSTDRNFPGQVIEVLTSDWITRRLDLERRGVREIEPFFTLYCSPTL
jgi:GT2 family glycosyltransferase